MKTKKTEENSRHKELALLRKEAQSVIIKRSGIPIKDLYQMAIDDFCARNIDLLTPAERKKYAALIL